MSDIEEHVEQLPPREPEWAQEYRERMLPDRTLNALLRAFRDVVEREVKEAREGVYGEGFRKGYAAGQRDAARGLDRFAPAQEQA
jgi:hypothetical protein